MLLRRSAVCHSAVAAAGRSRTVSHSASGPSPSGGGRVLHSAIRVIGIFGASYMAAEALVGSVTASTLESMRMLSQANQMPLWHGDEAPASPSSSGSLPPTGGSWPVAKASSGRGVNVSPLGHNKP